MCMCGTYYPHIALMYVPNHWRSLQQVEKLHRNLGCMTQILQVTTYVYMYVVYLHRHMNVNQSVSQSVFDRLVLPAMGGNAFRKGDLTW